MKAVFFANSRGEGEKIRVLFPSLGGVLGKSLSRFPEVPGEVINYL